jgi:outer membrane protein assembly factor BamD (BamD/ComL family)
MRLYSDGDKPLADSVQNRIVELRTKLAQKLLYSAELYLKLDSRKASISYFERVLDQYYDTTPAVEAQLRIAEVQTARGKTKEAQDAISKFDTKYLEQATPEQRTRAKSIKQSLAIR